MIIKMIEKNYRLSMHLFLRDTKEKAKINFQSEEQKLDNPHPKNKAPLSGWQVYHFGDTLYIKILCERVALRFEEIYLPEMIASNETL